MISGVRGSGLKNRLLTIREDDLTLDISIKIRKTSELADHQLETWRGESERIINLNHDTTKVQKKGAIVRSIQQRVISANAITQKKKEHVEIKDAEEIFTKGLGIVMSMESIQLTTKSAIIV